MVDGWSSSSSVEAPEPQSSRGVALALMVGGLIFLGLCLGGTLMMVGILDELDAEYEAAWEDDPDDRVRWRMELAVSERGRLREDEHLLPDENVKWLYCIDNDDLSGEGSMLTDRRLVSWWTDEDTGEVEEAYLSFEVVERLIVDWSDDESWYTYLTAVDDEGDELVLWLSPTDGLDAQAVYEARDLLRALNSRNYLGLTEEP